MRNGQGQGDERTILGAPFCQPGGSSDSDSDPIPQLPDAGGYSLVFLSRPVLHITQPAERRRVEVYSGFPLLPISLRPFLLAGQCVQCVSVVLLLVRLRTFVHIGSFLSLASIIVSRYLLQHLPLPIISRHRLPKTLLPRYFVL